MRTIWKFSIDETLMVKAPGLGKTVLVGAQHSDHWVAWVEVDTDRPDTLRKYRIVGTGHPIPDDAKSHVGSYIDGAFVWHVYSDEVAG